MRRFVSAFATAAVAFVVVPSMASADHWFWGSAWKINQPGAPLASYNETNGNWGDPTYASGLEPGEPNYCTGPGGTNYYEHTVWFEIHPHRPGNLVVRATSATSGFKPVIALLPFTPGVLAWGQGPCEVTGAGGSAQLPTQQVAAGSHYKIQLGGDTSGSVRTGSYVLDVIYDPDSDGDTVLDSADGCDTLAGPTGNGGCPQGVHPVDSDGDHIPDSEDRCKNTDARRRDRNHDGCLDQIKILAISDLDADHFLRGGRLLGLEVKRLRVKRLPAKAKVELTCKLKGRSVCARQVEEAGRSGRVAFRDMRNKNLRAGTRLYLRATLRNAVGRYIRYRILKGSFKKVDYCMKPGRRTPSKKC